jgi:hypothetical protein
MIMMAAMGMLMAVKSGTIIVRATRRVVTTHTHIGKLMAGWIPVTLDG